MSDHNLLSKGKDLFLQILTSKEARRRIPRAVWRAAKGPEPIFLEYPLNIRSRYGHGLPAHGKLYDLIDANRPKYLALLSKFENYAKKLSQIAEKGDPNGTDPYWQNDYIGGLDAIAFYCFTAIDKPATYIEIGSGNSTKFVRQSIRDNGLTTRIVSIDPTPRASIDAICDEIIRKPLEDVDPTLFEQLRAGDILVLDGSHRLFQNSDVAVFFLEIMPMLPPGVLIYIDDIFLPYDYPPKWADRFYSEQYVLAAVLLNDQAKRYEIVLPHIFIDEDKELFKASAKLWSKIGRKARKGNELGPFGRSGNGIWLRVDKPSAPRAKSRRT
jgi:hypothetical protein